MFAAVLLLLLYIGAALAPDSVLGRWLVREPARALATLKGRRLAVVATILFVTLVVIAPELMVLVGAADLALLADFAAVGLVLVATGRFEVVKWPAVALARLAGRPRRPMRRTRRWVGPRLLRPPRRDDADDPEWAFA